MSQKSVSSFFIPRKRGNDEDLALQKRKVICLDRFSSDNDFCKEKDEQPRKIVRPSNENGAEKTKTTTPASLAIASIRQDITPQRTRAKRVRQMQNVEGIQTAKVVNFFVQGSLSPQKKSKLVSQSTAKTDNAAIEKTNEAVEIQKEVFKTPTKNSEKTSINVEKTLLVPNNNNLNIDDVSKKLRGSSRLSELKASINKLKSGFDKLDQMEKKRTALPKKSAETSEAKTLKVFKNIEFEILSPKKSLLSPNKLKDSPMKNTLIGSPKHLTPRKLFSPVKSSPVKAPAYERYRDLVETGIPTLQLPYKYRFLLETFKAVDAVCAMFFNRKEKITFKKLKPAVQRILRKNIYESHLAQINHIMPNAYKFAQEKTRNFGSTSKQDYYQLVITPNLREPNEVVALLTLSPELLIKRTKEMTLKLTDLVYAEHEKFLQSLEVPMNITRGALKRWHPEFPLEEVPDVKESELPQPPNIEKFSCAKDVLSTARNLFNCSTQTERALERFEAKKKEERAKQIQNKEQQEASIKSTPIRGVDDANDERKKKPTQPATSSLLKGVPQSILDKIRAKQAAKALETMTRRPSQERDAVKYARLPEIARHVRNVFVTEKKGVILLESVLTKILNSYKACVSIDEIKELLQLIANETKWLSFVKNESANTMHLKINRDADLTAVIKQLQDLATKKAEIQ